MATVLKVVIDWNADGLFSGAYDDVTADIESINWSLGMRLMYQPVADESTCNIILKNTDGKYLPENIYSPLFGNIFPNRRIKVLSDNNGTETALWVGWIEFIKPTWLPGDFLPAVTITGTGNKRYMQDQEVTLEIYNDVTGDVIITDIIKQVNIPPAVGGVFQLDHPIFGLLPATLATESDYSDIETGLTVIPQYGDLKPPKALEAIIEVTAGEQGRFFFDRAGRVIWWNRHHLLSITADDAEVNTQSGNYRPVNLDYVFGEDVFNMIRITSNPRTSGESSQTLWSLDSPLIIPPSTTKTIEAILRKSTGQDVGSGALTPAPTFSSGFAIISVSADGGKATITIVNASASTPAVLQSLNLSGVPTTNQNRMDVVGSDDLSAATYGIRELSIDLSTMSDFDQAANVAAFELARRSTPLGNIKSLSYSKKFDGVDNDFLLDWEIGTRLKVTADEFGHEASYFVIGEQHSYKVADRILHKAKMTLEPANSSDFMILDDPVFGLLDQNRLVY